MTEISRSKEEVGNQASTQWLSPRRFAIILAVLVIIPFHQVLFGGHSFLIRDFGLFSYPVAYYLKESFWRGEIPFWNPMTYCGVPFLAQFNTLALYPPSLIYYLLPLTWALPFFCLLHLYMGGLGMYFLARRWSGSNLGGAIAGIVFAFNGLSLSMLMWPGHTAAYALMPWTVLCAETAWKQGGRHVLVAGLIAALQVLTGSPEEILLTWVFLGVLVIVHWREKQNTFASIVLRFVAVGVIAAGLSAPAWMPFLDLTAHSQRNTQFASANWSMPLSGWANFLVPLFQTQKWQSIVVQIGQYWTSSYYTGIATMFLVAIAILRRRDLRVVLLVMAVFLTVALAFGDAGHLYSWVKSAIPVLGMFRYPVKFVLLTTFCIAAISAYAVAWFENRSKWKFELPTAALVLAVIGFIAYLAKTYSTEQTPWQPTLVNAACRAGILLCFVGALFIFSQTTKARAIALGALPLLIWADLLTHVPWQNPTGESTLFAPGLAQMKVQLDPKPTLEQSRILMSPEASRNTYYRPGNDVVTTFLLERVDFRGNLNYLDGFAKADGFLSLNIKETDRLLVEIGNPSSNVVAHLEDLLGVSHTTAPNNEFEWVARNSYLPVISVGQEPAFGSEEENRATVLNPSTDIHKTVYLPLDAKGEVKAHREDRAQIVEKRIGANGASVVVDSPNPAITLISQSYYHFWKAYIDGNPAKIWRANYAFQAVEMPAGKHELKLVYEDTAFKIGSGIFVVTLALSIALWFYASKFRQPIAVKESPLVSSPTHA